MNRRRWLLAGAGMSAWAQEQLNLKDFEPASMLMVKETRVEKPRYPVIDFHGHLSFSRQSQKGVSLTGDRVYPAPASEILPVMERKGIQAMVNLTGGYGDGLREAIGKFDKAHPGRFLTFTEPAWALTMETGYPKRQADMLEQAVKRDGARGLKILKTLGLYLRAGLTEGQLVAVDDARFDPMWEACGALGIPVAIHVSDPVAFFEPTDRRNERFEELNNHPDWSFHGRDFPSNAQLLEARDRVFARHPRTQFVALHAGNFAENLAHVGERLERYQNMHIDIAARIGELGRQPRAAKRFFDRYQDRILFGTDAVPHGDEYPQQVFGDQLYEIYYRFLETEDEYFAYAPAKVPPQGRWNIYGLGLSDAVLRKVYQANAKRMLRL
jgi:predicted TIM-barrel fold metal-dependent hydrolase